MENCILCQIVKGKVPSKLIFEDKEVVAVLDVNGANSGHTFVMPKEHFTIMEQVPDGILAKTFNVSNRVSKAMFEALNIQGTNMFVSNGIAAGQMVAHFMVNVIPRKENDGINLQWKPKQISEEEMSTVELQLKNSVVHIPENEDKKIKKPSELPQDNSSEEENYLLKQIRRIP